MKCNNLSDWIDYIETLQPQKINLGLERVTQVASRGTLNQFKCPVITVAGTNGKGSTVKGIEQLLLKQGLKVGAYFSPHLFSFNERIQINGEAVTAETLVEAFETIEMLKEDVPLTYFEFTTLAAFHCFHGAGLDAIVLEVGLGGRLDAVNCVSPDIAVVTSIDYDHCEWLGDNLEAIAYEKAGIFRKEIPVILGREAILSSLMSVAKDLNVQLHQTGKDFDWKDNLKREWIYQGKILKRSVLSAFEQSDLLAMVSVEVFKAHSPSIQKQSHFSEVASVLPIQLPGRFLQFQGEVTHIFDVAHNPHGARWLAERVNALAVTGRVWAVWSSFKDKDLANIVAPFVEGITGWFVGELSSSRGANIALLSATLQSFGITPVFAAKDLHAVYSASIRHAQPGDVILVFGSFETVAALLPITEISHKKES